MAKLIRCIPAKSISLNIACSTCGHHKSCAVTEEHPTGETCDVAGELTDINEIKKWRCSEWALDDNINLNPTAS